MRESKVWKRKGRFLQHQGLTYSLTEDDSFQLVDAKLRYRFNGAAGNASNEKTDNENCNCTSKYNRR